MASSARSDQCDTPSATRRGIAQSDPQPMSTKPAVDMIAPWTRNGFVLLGLCRHVDDQDVAAIYGDLLDG